MQLIKNNPYRIVGLLVGASAKEQVRQQKRLKQFIEAEQDPEDDFSFPTLGKLQRSIEVITDASSKLNLDHDKMTAALFWFYKGNDITDEPAFDLLKEGNIKETVSLWSKLTNNKGVDTRNASAFHNLATLMLNYAFIEGKIKEDLFEKGLGLKLKFLESDHVKDLKALATDETFQTTKKELQLLFLKQVKSEIENHGGIASDKFLEILNKQNFSAKEEFLKEFVLKPIENIEKKIEESKKKRNGNDAKAGTIGNDLFNSTKSELALLKSILGTSDFKFISISDKLAHEILQCGITLFNHYHETETEVGEIALDLNNKASQIALGSIVKERINESTPIVKRYISDRPEREKLRKVKNEVDFISKRLERFQVLPDTIKNAKDLLEDCKPKIKKIRTAVGATDDLYLGLSSAIVQNVQQMLVVVVNEEVENPGHQNIFGLASLKTTITTALEVTFALEPFGMYNDLRLHYNKNLAGIKSIANQLNISTLSPKEKIQQELRLAENKLKEIEKRVFLQNEIISAQNELDRAKEWQFLRSESDRIQQISSAESKLNQLLINGKNEKNYQINIQQNTINTIKTKLQQTDF